MPGAFTPTCSTQHLPGYVKNAGKLAALGGISTIAVLTTNDRFVNEAWGSQQGALGSASADLVMLSDADGDYVKALGLADDMGFGVGVRSKRFVLVLQDGRVENVVIDEGLNDCSCTSAEAVLQLVAPPKALQDENSAGGMEISLVAVVAAAAAVLFAATSMGGGGGDNSAVIAPSPTATRVEKTNPSPASSTKQAKSQGFSLLEQYKP
jgi:glutaredoxin/glutathione-dependent peroxiredoxin